MSTMTRSSRQPTSDFEELVTFSCTKPRIDLRKWVMEQFCIAGKKSKYKHFHAGKIGSLPRQEIIDFLDHNYGHDGVEEIENHMQREEFQSIYRDSPYGTEPLQAIIDACYDMRMGVLKDLDFDDLVALQCDYTDMDI